MMLTLNKEDFLDGFYKGLNMTTDWEKSKILLTNREIEELCESLYDIFNPDIAAEIETYVKNKLGVMV